MDARPKRSFRREHHALSELEASEGWQIVAEFIESQINSARLSLDSIDPHLPGEIGRRQGSIKSLGALLCFPRSRIEALLPKINENTEKGT